MAPGRGALFTLSLHLFATACRGQQCSVECPDLDASGTVQVADLLLLLGAYGRTCPAEAAPAAPAPA
eukprot:COSAG04_NODE_22116_length_361_cov_0.587786_1_plen_66_part_10